MAIIFSMKNAFQQCNISELNTLPQDIPQLRDDEYNVYSVVNQYIRHQIPNPWQSKKTWYTAASNIRDFLTWCEKNDSGGTNIDERWLFMEEKDLKIYRNEMLLKAKDNGKRYSNNTINQRIMYASELLIFADRKGLRPKFSIEPKVVRIPKRGMLSHLDITGGKQLSKKLYLKKSEKPVEFLSREDTVRFINGFNLQKSKNTIRRNRLIAMVIVQTGLRLEELTNLKCDDIPIPEGYHSTAVMILGKGKKTRVTLWPNRLIGEIINYMRFDRAVWAEKQKKEPDELWLSENGTPLTYSAIEKIFSRNKSSIKCHPHLLRHTYATYFLYDYKHDNDALSRLSRFLGHEHLNTTQIYLHIVDILEIAQENTKFNKYLLENVMEN